MAARIASPRPVRAGALVVLLTAGALLASVPAATAAPDTIDLLARSNLQIAGAASGDMAGLSVAAAGDVNGDGRPDLIVGAPEVKARGRRQVGAAYVVFGRAKGGSVDLRRLGNNGFRIDGAVETDRTGRSVAGAGDVNGDGLADVLVGAPLGDTPDRRNPGAAYVVFGKRSSSTVDLANLGSGGYRLVGSDAREFAGISVANAGDVNGDGRPDALIGAWGAGHNGRPTSGSAYVVFGKAGTDTVDLGALGAGGYQIDGAGGGDMTGAAVANAGDVNGDGIPDAIVGAPEASGPAGPQAGAAYVVFGRRSTAPVDLATLGGGGFRIDGAAAWDRLTGGFGATVAGAGDVNGDGIPDVIVGAPFADPAGHADAGAAYVVFGKGSSDPVELGAAMFAGFEIDGSEPYQETGFSVAGAGDFNGDRLADVVVGAPWNRIYTGRTGEAYLVPGSRVPGRLQVGPFGGDGYLRIVGETNDQAGFAVAPAGDANRDGRPALLIGAVGGQPHLPLAPAGAAYVVKAGPSGIVRHGTPNNQVYIGGSGNDVLDGGRGDNVLYGLAGNDRLYGGDGHNRIYGGPGNDRIIGGNGDEVLDGGPGNDYIVGGYGHNRIYGGPGNDTIISAGGTPDYVDCGPGDDHVYADRMDRLRNCEHVRYRK